MASQGKVNGSVEAYRVKSFTVERGEVTLLLKERPPLQIYTWIWVIDDREQFNMAHMVYDTTHTRDSTGVV